mmetsp:Transcript_12094/g.17435  ORF Transcript_12094/g.17435 Transcript_12094/m.17435 type:complete len:108 (+) Transcript_12094:108-431(+)
MSTRNFLFSTSRMIVLLMVVAVSSFSPKFASASPCSTFETCATKNSWPECVDDKMTCEECKAYIEEGNKDKSVFIVPHDSFVTMDYNTDRVRIFCKENYVSRTPTIG